MSPAFAVYSPRIRPMEYDSLRLDQGCQTAEVRPPVGGLMPFATICVNTSTSPIFDRPAKVSYSVGPEEIGKPAPHYRPWAAWVSEVGIRLDQTAQVTLPDNTGGSTAPYFATLKPASLSLAFDGAGKVALAVPLDNFQTSLQWEGGEITFNGVQAVLFNPAAAGGNAGEMACYYLPSGDSSTLMVRLLSEDFAIAHTALRYLPVQLKQLLGAEAVGRTMVLYGCTDSGRKVELKTYPYNITVTSGASASVALSGGTYSLTAINSASSLPGRATVSTTLTGGSFSTPT